MQRLKPRYPKLNRNHPLARGLAAAWPFNEGAGSKLYDQTLYRNTGTLTNGPTWAPGLFGSAVKFASASSQYIDCGNNASLQITGALSISVWIKYTSHTAANSIVAKDNDTGGRAYTFDWDNVTGAFRLYINGGTSIVTYTLTPTDGVWYHLVATFVPSGPMAIYVNGSKVATATATDSSIPSATTNCRIGARAYTGFQNYTDGTIDGVAIWNRALSAAEVTRLYFDPFAIFRRSLYRVGVAAGGTSLTFPSAAWLWKGNAPLDTLALTQAQKSWVWSPHPPTDALAVTAAQKPWRWNGQAPSLTLAQTAAQKGWAWAKQAPALSFALGTIGKIWNWAASAATFAGGNFSAVSIIVRYIGPVWKRRRSVPVEQ